MAQRVEVVLEDDIDGGGADETVRFGCDGNSYEIDLSSEYAQALRTRCASTSSTHGRHPHRRGRLVQLGAAATTPRCADGPSRPVWKSTSVGAFRLR